MDVYKHLPTYEGKNFILRGVTLADVDDLLRVYSDEQAVPYFNGDNCHGDDFHYTTKERMTEAVKFWLFSYDNGYFVRWAIVDKNSGAVVGTIECFHREECGDPYGNCGLFRLDLRHDHENKPAITEILALLLNDEIYDLFWCDKLATKVKPFATERLSAIEEFGFTHGGTLKGNAGEDFTDYYLLKK